MEERNGWRGAFETAWGNLTGINDEGNIRVIRLMFFLVFLLGTAWATWCFRQGFQLMNLEAFPASPAPDQAQADKQRLDAMLQQVELTSRLRAGSPDAVRSLEENMAKHPFGQPGPATGIPLPEENAFAAVLPVMVVDYPPEITLRGVMIIGRQNVAVLDISGVGTGIIVRAGDTFMQKSGHVVSIAPDKVVVRWGGKNWDIVHGF